MNEFTQNKAFLLVRRNDLIHKQETGIEIEGKTGKSTHRSRNPSIPQFFRKIPILPSSINQTAFVSLSFPHPRSIFQSLHIFTHAICADHLQAKFTRKKATQTQHTPSISPLVNWGRMGKDGRTGFASICLVFIIPCGCQFNALSLGYFTVAGNSAFFPCRSAFPFRRFPAQSSFSIP